MDSVGEVRDRRVLAKLASIPDSQSRPFQDTLAALRAASVTDSSIFSVMKDFIDRSSLLQSD